MNTLSQCAEEREDTAQRSFLLKEQRTARWGGSGVGREGKPARVTSAPS